MLHGGSIVERTPDGKLYNTSLVFDAEGELLAGYRKIHRFGFDQGEAAVMSPGEHITTFSLRDIDDSVLTEVGLATCYDVRFPELYRKLVDAGVQTVVQVAAWPARRLSHWVTLCRARAIENQMYVLACAAAGTQADLEMTGHSLVIDPWGEVLAEADAAPTTIYAEIDPAYVPTYARALPGPARPPAVVIQRHVDRRRCGIFPRRERSSLVLVGPWPCP